jgi:glutathione S-transferase
MPMKLYDNKQAPNPRRVRIFLAEKGIEIPRQEIDIVAGETRSEQFMAINPLACVPVLELDDQTHLTESVAICRYLEELHPDPPLFGTDARDRAMVEMWNRRVELEIMVPVSHAFRHGHRFNQGKLEQIPEYAEQCRQAVLSRLAWLDSELADRQHIAGERFTIADISALAAIDFGRVCKIRIQPEQSNLSRWYESVSSRPSATA